MFSANENIQLRQYKRRIVAKVEECIPEDVLDLGVSTMVMQVSCKAPGCVPLETCIIVVFPTSTGVELLPGLPESAGGHFKTKILKPMSLVTDQDVLEAIPPEFVGGLQTFELLGQRARTVMLVEMAQLYQSAKERHALAKSLVQALQEFIDRGCEDVETNEEPINGNKNKPLVTTQNNGAHVKAGEEGTDESPNERQIIDVVLAQITQLLESPEERHSLALYLQQALHDYMERNCDDDSAQSTVGQEQQLLPTTSAGKEASDAARIENQDSATVVVGKDSKATINLESTSNSNKEPRPSSASQPPNPGIQSSK